ncbi:hypothetical protein Acy02nite_86900 [Actinoplanes cyaneus]|uniref:Uncharacterized protein n=1 Tax=Actinoplanes cyaneus TaxID=52696 RepID=A0A919IS82_9ACTN|nr:hypothetical protein [Actinoplanes cyaneus]GID70809.1 hypothetical protein Acy02nite_86900 [Actinoplanes cyaneus]
MRHGETVDQHDRQPGRITGMTTMRRYADLKIRRGYTGMKIVRGYAGNRHPALAES